MSEPRDPAGSLSPPSSPPAERTERTTPIGGRRPLGGPRRKCASCGFRPFPEQGPCPWCGAAEPEPEDGALEPDTVVYGGPPSGTGAAIDLGTIVDGRYRVESELGRGGMGVVYLARDTWLERGVALKMITPSWAKDGEAAAAFQREAKALASIRSPFVVQVYAFGVHQGRYFFAMEYVRGRSVLQILTEHRKHGDTIPPHRTLTILNRIAQGIDAVHAAGILHRDVKPSNIVIEEDTGRPVLVDFGLAVPGDDPTAALAIGTPQYMAPEQGGVGVPGAAVTARIDIYALGVTAFEMLTGELPFDATDRARLMRQHARKHPPSLSSRKPDLAPFDKTIARALAKDPADRYPSCTAFAEVLAAASERWVDSVLPTLPPPPAPPPKAPSVAAKKPIPKAPRPPAFSQPPPTALSQPPPAAPPSSKPSSSKPSSSQPSPTGPVSFHVLVVDDSPVFRKFTVQATEIAFYRRHKNRVVAVRGAGSGKEAIELASQQPPDLVILDFDMPGLDGIGTLSRLRELPGGHGARVVVLSGRVSAEHRWRFSVLGVGDFVKKPIDFRHLVDRLEAIARRFEDSQSGAQPAVPGVTDPA
jgi:serine/threonine-protein kinase